MKPTKFLKKLTAAAVSAVMCLSAMIPAASAAATYTVTTQTNGHGTATASPSSLAAGETFTLTATPDEGYVFDHWEVTDTNGGTGTTSTKTANIAMVIDVTGSMSSDIQKVHDNLEAFINELNSQGITVNLRFVTYYDKEIKSYPYSDGSIWSSDVAGAIDILDQILNDKTHGSYEYACLAFNELLDANGKLDFPTANNNYVFLLTDEDCDTVSGSSATASDPANWNLDKWTDFFAANGVRVTTVCNPKDGKTKTQYGDLSSKTGGLYIDINTPDYYKLLLDFAQFINDTVISVNETYYTNPCTVTMPACNIYAKAVFKAAAAAPKTYKITVATQGSGTAYASAGTALPGTRISITANPNYGNKVEYISVSGGASLSGSTFTMPAADVVVTVKFTEDIQISGYPHSYIYSYDNGECIAINSNRKFTTGSDEVSITVKLGDEYAGKSYVIYTGKKAKGGTKIAEGTLNSKGQATIKVPMRKNFHLIVED